MSESRSKELARQIQEAFIAAGEKVLEGGSEVKIAFEPTDWPLIVQGLLQLPEPDNFAQLLHRAVLDTADADGNNTMTCHIPILHDTQSAQAHVAGFRLIFRQFAAEFALRSQRSMDEIMLQLIHELHAERKMPIGEKPEYQGPLIELPPGVKAS